MAGTLTRDQLVTEIANVVGKSENATAVSGATLQARIRTYLGWAQRRIARAHDWYELQSRTLTAATVASTRSYPLESGTNNLGLTRVRDIRSIVLVDSANSRTLARWSYRKFDARFPRPENYSNGRPSLYIREGDNVELFRVPDAAYTLRIRYSTWPTPFTTGGQTSDFSNKDELIITAGVLETYLALEEYADAKVWFEKFKGQLMDAIEVEGDRDWAPEADPFGKGSEPIIGEPWLSPEGYIDDPLYGYGG